MLHALEAQLLPPVDAALPVAVTVVAGPWTPAADTRALAIHARQLSLPLPSGDDDEPPQDDPPHLLSSEDFDSDGTLVNFELSSNDELIEVEAPPGVLVNRGDAYFLDGATLRFYQPPAAGSPSVRVRQRGTTIQGWKRRRRCTVTLELHGYAPQRSDADAQLNTALQVVLAELVELPMLAAVQVAGVQVWLRLRRPQAWLQGIERSLLADPSLHLSRATLELRGEFDVLVGKGEPPPVGVIEQIAGSVAIDRADGAPPLPEAFDIAGQSPAAPAGPPPVEGEAITLLATLGAQAEADFAGLTPPVTTLVELAALDLEAAVPQLQTLSEAKAAEFRQRAKLVLAFGSAPLLSSLPELPAPALATSLSDLLAQDLPTLSTNLGLGPAYALALRDELLTLTIVLTATALADLTLADFTPS